MGPLCSVQQLAICKQWLPFVNAHITVLRCACMVTRKCKHSAVQSFGVHGAYLFVPRMFRLFAHIWPTGWKCPFVFSDHKPNNSCRGHSSSYICRGRVHASAHRQTPDMTSLPGQYTGFYHYCYNKRKYPCMGTGCKNAAGSHPNNYESCKACVTVQWFENYITYFRTDDINRADARMRLSLPKPLLVHREVQKKHKLFREKGGAVFMLGNSKDLPTLRWSTGPIKFVVSAAYPTHLSTTSLP